MTSIIRRWLTLAERWNTFWAMAVNLAAYWPLSLIAYGLLIDQVTSNRVHVGTPAVFFLSFVPLGNTFGPLTSAWLNLSSKRMTQKRHRLRDWPWHQVLSTLLFNVGSLVAVLLASVSKYYDIGLRLLMAVWAIFVLVCSIGLYVGSSQIKGLVHDLSTVQQTTSTRSRNRSASSKGSYSSVTSTTIAEDSDRPVKAKEAVEQETKEEERFNKGKQPPSLDVVKNVIKTLNRVLVFVVCMILIPAFIAFIIVAAGQTYIDTSVWAEMLILAIFRFWGIGYCLFWSVLFWNETSFRTSHSSDTTSTV